VRKKALSRGIKEPDLDLSRRDDVFLPQDDWSLFPLTLILCYPKVGLFLPQRRRFTLFL